MAVQILQQHRMVESSYSSLLAIMNYANFEIQFGYHKFLMKSNRGSYFYLHMNTKYKSRGRGFESYSGNFYSHKLFRVRNPLDRRINAIMKITK